MRHAPHIWVWVLLVAAVMPVSGTPCGCHRPEKHDQTRWGGNEAIVEVREKHYRELTGVVKLGADPSPIAGALVEIFDNPEYLLHEFPQNRGARQKRLRACVTGGDGSFCFRNLPSAAYEVRVSLSAGIDVTHVYAVIDTSNGSKATIEITLRVGT